MFIGRTEELKQLQKLKSKKTSSLICVLGRRRIGKSSLIEEFGKTFKYFINIQGLAPVKGITNQHQLNHFANMISKIFKTDKFFFENWGEAFEKLGELTQKGQYLILLDEISWMGKYDPTFTAHLKEVWDRKLKKNNQLIFVCCGSVSSWIEDNITKNMNFEGRISLEINLQELSLKESNLFLQKKFINFNFKEKLFTLSVTGGVPKYLEEFIKSETLEKNITRLCFTKEGILFNDFEKIFTEIFERKSKTLEKIVRACLTTKLSPAALAKKLNRVQNEELKNYIHILELSGFLSRDFYYKPNGEISKLSHLRVSDNYLRFYLKNIEPIKDKISKKMITIKTFEDIKNFDSILGYQFENLVLANRQIVHELLELENNEILYSSPYKQDKKVNNKGGCQVDLLIGTNKSTYFLCEIKFQNQIDKTIIQDIKKKINFIELPKKVAIHPVLICNGDIYLPHLPQLKEFFYKIISFEDLIKI